MNSSNNKNSNSKWLTRREHDEISKAWRENDNLYRKGHEALHKAEASALVLVGKANEREINRLNELRQEVTKDRVMFLTREIYDTQRQADQRLIIAILGLIVIAFATTLGILTAMM